MAIAWTAVLFLVGAAIGIGVNVVGWSPPEVVIARTCFAGSAVLLAAMTAFWSYKTDWLLLWRIVVCACIGGALLVLLPESLRWVNRREALAAAGKNDRTPQTANATAEIASAQQQRKNNGLRVPANQRSSHVAPSVPDAKIKLLFDTEVEYLPFRAGQTPDRPRYSIVVTIPPGGSLNLPSPSTVPRKSKSNPVDPKPTPDSFLTYEPQPPTYADDTVGLARLSGGAWNWPTDAWGKPPLAAKCMLTNESSETLINVRVQLTLTYYDRKTSTTSNKGVKRKSTVLIPKIKPGASNSTVFFIYTLLDGCTIFVSLPETVTVELIGDKTARVIPLSITENAKLIAVRAPLRELPLDNAH